MVCISAQLSSLKISRSLHIQQQLLIYLYLWQRANGEQIADAAHKLFSNYLYIDYNQLEIGLFPRSKGSLEIHGTYVIF